MSLQVETTKTVKMRARALYKFEACEDDELPMRAGEIITVLDERYSENWWKAESHRGTGLVPHNYISTLLKPGRTVQAMCRFKSEGPNQLALEGGDIVTVLDDSKTQWWKGKSSSGTGFFPANYVTPYAEEESKSSASNTSTMEVRKVQALCDFEAEEVEELGFSAGEVITVLHKTNKIWWKGKSKTGTGMFPVAHVMALGPVDTDKIETLLMLIRNLKTAGFSEPDSETMLKLENLCKRMRPLVESNIEELVQQEEKLKTVYSKLEDSLGLFRTMLAEGPRLCSTHQQITGAASLAGDSPDAATIPHVNQSSLMPTGHPSALPISTSTAFADSSFSSNISILQCLPPHQQNWQPVPTPAGPVLLQPCRK